MRKNQMNTINRTISIPPDPDCPTCGGLGVIDSGGVSPDGAALDRSCSCTEKQSDAPSPSYKSPAARLGDTVHKALEQIYAEDRATSIRVGSALLVRNGSGHVLLGLSKKPGVEKWIIPGGGIHLYESMRDAGKREVFEETGIEVVVSIQIGVFELIAPGQEHRVIVFHDALTVEHSPTPVPAGDLTRAAFFDDMEIQSLEAFDMLSPLTSDVLLTARMKLEDAIARSFGRAREPK